MADLGDQNLRLADQARKHATTIALQATKAEGQPADAKVSIGTEIHKKRFDLGFTAWVKRVFKRDGTSAGVDAKIEF